jgi:hypothetical protein
MILPFPVLSAVVFTIGCSGEPPVGTVTGTVTFNGKPAKGGMISFMPAAGGVPVTVTIDGNGIYKAESVPAGPVMVSVESLPDDSAAVGQKLKESGQNPTKGPASPAAKPMAYPPRYAQFESSGLKTTVKPNRDGLTTFDVPMTQ